MLQVALDRYGSVYNSEQFNKYVVYLYMSHYIDNPNYTRENPDLIIFMHML